MGNAQSHWSDGSPLPGLGSAEWHGGRSNNANGQWKGSKRPEETMKEAWMISCLNSVLSQAIDGRVDKSTYLITSTMNGECHNFAANMQKNEAGQLQVEVNYGFLLSSDKEKEIDAVFKEMIGEIDNLREKRIKKFDLRTYFSRNSSQGRS